MVVYVLVQSFLHCGKLVCERMEGGIAQAGARIMMLNALGNAEGKNGRSSWINDHIGLQNLETRMANVTVQPTQ